MIKINNITTLNTYHRFNEKSRYWINIGEKYTLNLFNNNINIKNGVISIVITGKTVSFYNKETNNSKVFDAADAVDFLNKFSLEAELITKTTDKDDYDTSF